MVMLNTHMKVFLRLERCLHDCFSQVLIDKSVDDQTPQIEHRKDLRGEMFELKFNINFLY